ncbi:uncharacterized protein LOC141906456 isoform X2 [Tubulanus polymorphus]|uniref:uncharacterized protein LOC141906456 isoform X2 n=1 Tax=Tubulanus polymorphus TaxID=672921 RepID=UPI003DA6214F
MIYVNPRVIGNFCVNPNQPSMNRISCNHTTESIDDTSGSGCSDDFSIVEINNADIGDQFESSMKIEDITNSLRRIRRGRQQQMQQQQLNENVSSRDIEKSSNGHQDGFFKQARKTLSTFVSQIITPDADVNKNVNEPSASPILRSKPTPQIAAPLMAEPRHIFEHSESSSTNVYLLDHHSEESASAICNTFWRPSLTFNTYSHGDDLIKFTSLWPKENVLPALLLEAYHSTSLRKSILEISKLVIRCGPVSVLKSLLDLHIIGLDQRFEDGYTMLHLACIARNDECVSYLCSSGISMKLQDKYGRTADQVCNDSKTRRLLPSRSMKSQRFSIKPVSLHEKEAMFQTVLNPRSYNNLQIRLQTSAFDVNKEVDCHGDFLIHIVARGGLSLMPLLLSLVRIQGADIELSGNEGLTPLMIAACQGNAVILDVMLCILGANPNTPNPINGRCALHYAAQHNHADIVNCLIKRGADYNLEDYYGRLPDDHCGMDCREIISSHRQQRIECLRELLKTRDMKSANLRVTDLYCVDNLGNTLIMTAALNNNVEDLCLLIEYEGCPINAQHEKSGRTALSMACMVGHPDIVRELLRHDAEAGIPDIFKKLAVHYAVENNHYDVLEQLLSCRRGLVGLPQALTICSNQRIRDLLLRAKYSRQVEIVNSELFECALTGDASKLYTILEDGDDVNNTSGVGDWPIYLAGENGNLEVVSLLYEFGGNVSKKHPNSGNTLLHVLCERGHLEIVQYLLQFSRAQVVKRNETKPNLVYVNAVNNQGKTSLQIAAERGLSKIVNLLLKHGATTALVDQTGNLFQCPEYQGIQVLLETHRDERIRQIINFIDDKRKLNSLKCIWQPRFDHNLRDRWGDTPLMIACRLGRIDAVKFLLQSALYDLIDESDTDNEDSGADSDEGSFLASSTFSRQSTRLSAAGTALRSASNFRYEDLRNDLMTPVSTYTVTTEINQNHVNRMLQTPRSRMNTEETIADLTQSYDSSSDYIRRRRERTASEAELPAHHSSNLRRVISAEDIDSMKGNGKTFLDLHNEKSESSQQLDSYLQNLTLHKASIFTGHRISHVCATNTRNGRTAVHRTIEYGDNLNIFAALLSTDENCVNIQDNEGIGPIHLACKLGRKKIIERLMMSQSVDLNVRTLDGRLPEEMTNSKTIEKLIKQKREQKQPNRPPSPVISITASSISRFEKSTIDIQTLQDQFTALTNQVRGKTPALFTDQ